MPRRKKTTAAKKTQEKKSVQSVPVVEKQPVQPTGFRWAESYTSLLLGACVVIIGILFFVSVAKIQNTKQTTSIATTNIPTTAPLTTTPAEVTEAPTQQPQKQQVLSGKQQTYTVAAGDDLWHIAEKFYKSGYNYVDIAKANNLENPSVIYTGTKLIIPQVTPAQTTATLSPTQMPAPPQVVAEKGKTDTATQSIKGNTYTVQKGDDLWDIAVRAYGDGYKWTEIAKANNLTDPGLIHSGNSIKIPR